MSRSVTIYCLDVSEGMAELVPDPATGEEVSKIELAKEYIQRKIAPKVSTGRISYRIPPAKVELVPVSADPIRP
jgi:hypothetical protein